MIRIDGQLDKIERMVRDIETAQLNQEIFASLKNGTEALQKLNEVSLFGLVFIVILYFQQFTIEDAEKIMEESLEAQAYQQVNFYIFKFCVRNNLQEISDILTSKLTSEDLEAVENEYEELIREQLPEVPTHALPANDEIFAETLLKKIEKKKTERVALEAS